MYSPLQCVMTAALAAMLATPEDKQLVNIAEKPATQNQGLCACAQLSSKRQERFYSIFNKFDKEF